MLRRGLRVSVLVTAICASSLWAQSTEFFAEYCTSCHNAKLRTANLNLEQTPTDPTIREKILDKLSTGRMPPPGSPAPLKAEVETVTASLRVPFTSSAAGHFTAHRLNRTEYDNTIRDLFGVDLHPAAEFPLDDAGYGFDNIGDVLSVSPLLMEKYTAAAKSVARTVIYGETAPAKPSKLIRFLGKKLQDDPTANALPFSYRGSLWTAFDFPVDGEYELHMRVANYRPRDRNTPRQRQLSGKKGLSDAEKAELAELNRLSDPPVKMMLMFDGKPILSEIVEGNIDYRYAHGESIARVKVKAGEHSFRASYPEFAALANPLTNVNTDGRRKLFIDYIDVIGPFNATPVAPESRKRLYICAEKTPDCSKRIIANAARRAWRRPPSPVETEELAVLASMVRKDSESFDEGIRVALQAILMSPNFLFRVEGDPNFDLASRLSYFLWSSTPDDELLRLAAAKQLSKPAVLEAQARRMLADPKSDALIDNFVAQWLGLRQLDRRKPDPARFPIVDDELIEAMRHETKLFARAILREDRSVLDFIGGRFTFVNGPLALYYGIPGVTGEDFERVTLDGVKRGGVLTQGSVLVLSSYATRTSPVIRGKWVLENLLGAAPPPPPPDVPALEEKNLGTDASMRQRLEQHRANPVCAVCHQQMDPIGFALENYDASGAWRDLDGKFPIDSTGTLPDGRMVHGPAELKDFLRAKPELFARNFTERLMTYALGRGLEPADRATVDKVMRIAQSHEYRFPAIVTAIAEEALMPARKDTTYARK